MNENNVAKVTVSTEIDQCGHCFGQDGTHYDHCATLYWTEARERSIMKARQRATEATDLNKLEYK